MNNIFTFLVNIFLKLIHPSFLVCCNLFINVFFFTLKTLSISAISVKAADTSAQSSANIFFHQQQPKKSSRQTWEKFGLTLCRSSSIFWYLIERVDRLLNKLLWVERYKMPLIQISVYFVKSSLSSFRYFTLTSAS